MVRWACMVPKKIGIRVDMGPGGKKIVQFEMDKNKLNELKCIGWYYIY